MKLLPFCLLFLCVSLSAQSTITSPNEQCFEDLQFLVDALKKSPSYKEQIKGEKRKAFQEFVRSIEKEIMQDESVEIHCRMYLQQVLYQIRDWHLRVFPRKEIDFSLRAKRNLLIPKADLPPAALRKKAIAQADNDPWAGLYWARDSSLLLSVYRNEDQQLEGIILDSKERNWEPGTVKFLIWETEKGASGYIYSLRREALYFEAHSPAHLFDRWGYRKEGHSPSYHRPKKRETKHGWEDLGNGVAYLYLSTFDGTTENIREIKGIYKQILPQLSHFQHLIIDIRNNGGGGQVCYNTFLKGLDELEQLPQLHLIINRYTGSAAEHFTLEMRSRSATIYGENTVGAINYRYPNRPKKNFPSVTPNYQYRLKISVAKNPKKYRDLPSESTGITPDFQLKPKDGWLEQVLEKIQ